MAEPVPLPVPHSSSLARRLPARTEWGRLYAAAAVPVHTWAVLIFFHALPAYLLRLSLGNILVILAYVLALALIESALVAGVLVGLAQVLPQKVFSLHTPGQAVGLTWLLFAWMIPTHFQIAGADQLILGMPLDLLLGAGWTASLALAILFFFAWLRAHPGLGLFLSRVAERFTLLAGLYFFLDLVGLSAILVRLFF